MAVSIKNSDKRLPILFIAISIMVIFQVAWWTYVFYSDVDVIARLTLDVSDLKAQVLGSPPTLTAADVAKNVFHRRFMFLSESITFVILTSFGLFMLFKALKNEQRLKEVQRNFIETLTHESKTPLTALKLRLESTLEKNSGSPGVEKDLTQSLEEVRRLSSILEKALNLNRLENYEFSFEEISLHQVLREVLRRLEPLFRGKNVAVTTSMCDDAFVRGDYYALQSTVQGLIENAVLYNEKQDRELKISLVRQANQIILQISDNGSGISETDRPHIFERFYRGKNSRKIPGTGLGLYLASTVIAAHHGVIKLLKSGMGSKFEISLPLCEGNGGAV